MTKQGHIEIMDNEVIFVYHELPEPERNNYYGHGLIDFETVPVFKELAYNKAMKEYEASKRSVKVSNVRQIKWLYFFYFGNKVIMHPDYEVKHNQPCEAEIENDKAKITKII